MSRDPATFLDSQQALSRESLEIEDGAIRNIAYNDKDKRTKNWVACVTRDLTAPGGLARRFLGRGPRNWVFLTEELRAGDWLEFGGDKVSSMGKRKYRRQYREVVSSTDTEIVLRPIGFDEIGRISETDVDPPGGTTFAQPAARRGPMAGVSDADLLSEVRRRGLAT